MWSKKVSGDEGESDRLPQRRLQAGDQLGLRRIDLLARRLGVEPAAAIHLREGEPSAGAAGPLRPHRVAGDPVRVRISLPGPRVDFLARLLADASEREERAFGPDPGLLLELAERRGERLFTRLDQALWNGSGAGILM